MDHRSGRDSPRDHAKVVVEPIEESDHPLHRELAHIDMKVAQLQDGEAIEGFGQMGRCDAIVPDLDLCRVAGAAPIKTRSHQRGAHQGMRQGEVLDVKEVDALAEDLRLVVRLDAEALARIAPAESLFQKFQDGVARHGSGHEREAFGSARAGGPPEGHIPGSRHF